MGGAWVLLSDDESGLGNWPPGDSGFGLLVKLVGHREDLLRPGIYEIHLVRSVSARTDDRVEGTPVLRRRPLRAGNAQPGAVALPASAGLGRGGGRPPGRPVAPPRSRPGSRRPD